MLAVSVIVPVYNVAAYLRAGLESLARQVKRAGDGEARKVELVCVDDGSTDGSSEILDAWASEASWREGAPAAVVVVHKANGGLSSARNAGLARATGEVVLFMDPDDVVGPDWLATLVKGIEGVDLAWGGFTEDVDGRRVTRMAEDVGSEYFGEAVRRRVWRAVFGYRLRDLPWMCAKGGLWRHCRREFGSVCWRAFRRDVIGDLRFNERVRLYEDAIFLSEYARRAKSMRVIGDTGYHYFIRRGGMMSAEARERMPQHKFELRDARREIDPKMSAWRGTFVLSALQILKETKSLRMMWRYVTFRPFAD
ncbi:MAG: glycosyltransferase family 2 protein [Kiritimatiellia bacterium]